MKIKIGFIGIEELKLVIEKVAREFEELEIHHYFYQSENEAIELAKRAQKEVDVILYGGPVPYELVKDNPEITIPQVFISYDGAAFYRGLLDVTHKANKSITSISVDTVSEGAVHQIFMDLGMSTRNVHVHPSMQAANETFTDFHIGLFESGITSCAVTCLRSTYRLLKEKGIDCVLVLATESAIREGIQRAILLFQSDYFQKSQMVVGILQVGKLQHLSEFDMQRCQLEVHHKLINWAQELNAGLFPVGPLKFLFYTTKGSIEKKHRSFVEEVIKDLGTAVRGEIQIGLGIGNTASIAETRAKTAIQHGMKQVGDQCFMIIDERYVINILDQDHHVNIYRADSRDLAEVSEKHQISLIVLERIALSAKKMAKSNVTAEELAEELGQTPRNVRRVLKELTEKGLANPVGEIHPGGKGRPKIVYDLVFINES